MVIAAGLLDFFWTFVYWSGRSDRFTPWLIGHLVCTALPCALVYISARHADAAFARGWTALCAMIGLAVPGVGTVCMGLLFVLAQRRSTSSSMVDSLMAFMESPEPSEEEDDRTVEDQIEEYMMVEPIVDLIPQADPQTMQAIVDLLADSRDRRMIERLYTVLEDPRAEVYQHALSKISRLQEKYALRIYEAQENVRIFPDVAESHVALADEYFGYLNSGLLDSTLEEYYFRLTVERFQAALRIAPDTMALHMKFAELHLHRGEFETARALYADISKKWPDNAEARLRRVEVHYDRALSSGAVVDYESFLTAVAESRGKIDPQKIADAELRGLVEWWFAPRDRRQGRTTRLVDGEGAIGDAARARDLQLEGETFR